MDVLNLLQAPAPAATAPKVEKPDAEVGSFADALSDASNSAPEKGSKAKTPALPAESSVSKVPTKEDAAPVEPTTLEATPTASEETAPDIEVPAAEAEAPAAIEAEASPQLPLIQTTTPTEVAKQETPTLQTVDVEGKQEDAPDPMALAALPQPLVATAQPQPEPELKPAAQAELTSDDFLATTPTAASTNPSTPLSAAAAPETIDAPTPAAARQEAKVSKKGEAALQTNQAAQKPATASESFAALSQIAKNTQTQAPNVAKVSSQILAEFKELKPKTSNQPRIEVALPQTAASHEANTAEITQKDPAAPSQQAGPLQDLERKVTEQVRFSLKASLKNQVQSIEMKLRPAMLGNIQVKIAHGEGGSSASFTVENASVKEILMKTMQSLKDSFAEKGIDIQNIEVEVAKDQNSQNFGQQGGYQKYEDEKSARNWLNSFYSFEVDNPEAQKQEKAAEPNGSLNLTA